MNLRLLGSAALGCSLLAGCGGRSVDRPAAIGTYEVVHDFGRERLLLKSDGSYEQAFGEGRREPAVVNRGTWRLESRGLLDGTQIVFEDMVEIHDPFGNRGSMKRSSGLWVYPVRRGWRGGVTILLNPDTDLSLVKIR
jgi:hypothetical protein